MEREAYGYHEQQNHAQYYMRDRKSLCSAASLDDAAREFFSESSAPPQVWPSDLAGVNDALTPEQTALEQNESYFRTEVTAEIIDPEGETTVERLFRYLTHHTALRLQKEKMEIYFWTELSGDQWKTWDYIRANNLFRDFVERYQPTTRCLLIIAGEHCGETISTTSKMAAAVRINSACKVNEKDVISTFVIGWFCADDTQMWDRKDPHKPVNISSRLMMASLICQLLDRMMIEKIECHLSFINSEFNWDDIGKWELQVLSEIFTRLVSQAPEGSQIICVIDEICSYEDYDPTEDDANKAINALVAIANSAELLTGPRYFKLLLTCEDEAPGIEKKFKSKDQIMKVPQEVEVPTHFVDYPDSFAGLES
ncbi:hypothetical protein JMJ77_0000208 [Colletotrichum scovillei]|uniref:Uncharacterized protein n=1 Tax=Colletotrichum scovillei TaxID=1209932 RepID=A0A9P7RBS7_9PEZI|nr:hypothetical protein JMJ77_0000208 [Colletotrichum scovillei]KAG7071412.1 hypothetical protein JMJ76_0004285 [Colletotrichum scovillei]KAG7079663.1 hypothetical protein JMJ78_0006769 [Colletotrichum scovillei]